MTVILSHTASESAIASALVALWKLPDAAHRIEIHREDGESLGFLRPITARDAADTDICEALTMWRQAARESFVTQFTATTARTRAWLEKRVLVDDTRLLFLLTDVANRNIGNIGLSDITSRSAEIDNVLRGEVAASRYMYYTLLALIRWAFNRLQMEQVSLHVFSNNARARKLYELVGFQVVTSLQLARVVCDDGVRYETRVPQVNEQVDVELVRMELASPAFWERHAWMRQPMENH